jgi:hypothetical protein
MEEGAEAQLSTGGNSYLKGFVNAPFMKAIKSVSDRDGAFPPMLAAPTQVIGQKSAALAFDAGQSG